MKKRWSIVGLMLIFSLVLSACGGFSGGTGGGGKKDTKGQTSLHLNIKTEPFSLHPGLANDTVSGGVIRQIFEGLTRVNSKGEPEEGMASKIETSKDGKTYTFTIRDGAKWSNGDPVTAQDFEYAWKWVLDPNNESQYAYQLYYIKGAEAANKGKGKIDDVGVKAVNDQTLKVELNNPTPYFLQLTSFYTYMPVNKKIAEKHKNWNTNAGDNYVSNGPFKMTAWKHSGSIDLVKNDEYWDKDSVKLKKINMVMINNTNTELKKFQAGELDWAGMPLGQLPTESLPTLKKDGSLHVEPIAGVYWYKFNTEAKPLNNVNIRKALTYALDRASIVKNVTQGEQVPAMAAVPPSMKGFKDNTKGYFKDNDVKTAKEYLDKGLKELGVKKASDLPVIKLSYNTDEAHAKIAQAVQEMWKKNLGVNVELDNSEWNVFIDKLHSQDYQIGRMGWLGDFNDPINFLELFRDKEGGNNDTGWEDPEFKKLLDQSQLETNPDKRIEELKKAEKIFIDAMPVAPIYFYTDTWVQDKNLKNVIMTGTGEVYFRNASFE
ncbi:MULTISPECIES: peptide ABC transporter substrate-binding protein [Bacillus]|uniref:peptide ABC transporter substrate-binding protein n=1 Tax=Bacillus TaxID=1386 RepID=UPI000826A361|nr:MULTISPECIES: peptide ABC transporter substrate-binding protein [Bacillus]AOC90572.1 Oligopeptide-binding protein OppA [Bacillus amyloliquefaciens]MCR9037690.1 peptide ABC transporter substrate-binding protein [Bacillus velezensis]QUN10606.1 peptide ABC transporter substrate-binding protein [Bacillus amyloliquefaciens]QYM83738.1 peptide ABC transporter substrate-binding protein [Bacillus sp. 7D3]QZY12922.1 peptide ABC transporter substrate-binding protein [Bacillus amyloliquefaciens]